MILDTLQNASLYYSLGQKFVTAFDYLINTDFSQVEKGKYEIEGTRIFAIVSEYTTKSPVGEKMESHKKYIDIQYIVKGKEFIGHDFLKRQTPSDAYNDEKDFMLFAETPSFFSKLDQGMFGIFFPGDLHMPNIQAGGADEVKKVVIKISVD